MPDDEPNPRRRARVVRGEGEVTEWPRGLASYVPRGPKDATPSPEEDRTANRLQLAARLLGLLQARGEDVTHEIDALRDAESTFARGERSSAARQVDGILARIGARSDEGTTPARTP